MDEFRKTKSVKLIIDVFEHSNRALSVVDLVKSFESEMNKTTVYRILDRLEEHFVLHSFTGRDGLKWYAKCSKSKSSQSQDMHPHFQCHECGKSECLHIDLSVPTVPNYKVESACLLLTGVCQECIS